jgi:PTH1 family peptidyl-tRNA hydrolase
VKVIIGLGNPGPKYKATRHNAGWMVLSNLAKRHNAKAKYLINRHRSVIETMTFNSEEVLIVYPLTFMNLSGIAVNAVRAAFSVEIKDILVVCDDIHVPPGKIRIRPSGSAGGQNGLKSIQEHLGTQEYPRMRIGIGKPVAGTEQVDWVLGKLSPDEQIIMDATADMACDAIEHWLAGDLTATMAKFNGLSVLPEAGE